MNNDPGWLMLVSSVPGANQTARMRIWRALKASGAGALRDGVYVLPNSDSARTLFEEQARSVAAIGGTAQIVAFDSSDEAQHGELRRLFDRGKEYAALLEKFDPMTRTRNFCGWSSPATVQRLPSDSTSMAPSSAMSAPGSRSRCCC